VVGISSSIFFETAKNIQVCTKQGARHGAPRPIPHQTAVDPEARVSSERNAELHPSYWDFMQASQLLLCHLPAFMFPHFSSDLFAGDSARQEGRVERGLILLKNSVRFKQLIQSPMTKA
jgi:hypothetical protein